jgi:hypothetical protein
LLLWLIVRLLLELLELLVELLLRLVALGPGVRARLVSSSERERAMERREWAMLPGVESGPVCGAGSRTSSPPSAVEDRGCGVLATGAASGTWRAGGASATCPSVEAPEVGRTGTAGGGEAVATV